MPTLSSFISYLPRKSKPLPVTVSSPRHPYASPILDINVNDHQRYASSSTPRVQLDMPSVPEPLTDWFPSGLDMEEDQGADAGDGDVLDGLKASDVVNDIHFDPPRPAFSRKRAPSPIKIPHSTTRVQLMSTPQVSSSPESSAVSGTTLARALIANTFVLSPESRQSRYSTLTRTDSATLPRSEYGVHSPRWRDTLSTDGSFEPDIPPPVPLDAERVYVPPKTQREAVTDAAVDDKVPAHNIHIHPQPEEMPSLAAAIASALSPLASDGLSSPPASDPPSSAKDFDNVLDYYAFADSPELTTVNEQRTFRPAVSPITEETSSQLSPPTPYVGRTSLVSTVKSPDSVKSSTNTKRTPGRFFLGDGPSASAGGARVGWTIHPSSSSSASRRESSASITPSRSLLPIGNRSRSASTTSVTSLTPPRPSTSTSASASTSTSGANTPAASPKIHNTTITSNTTTTTTTAPNPTPPTPTLSPLPLVLSSSRPSISSIPESVTDSLFSSTLQHPPSPAQPSKGVDETKATRTRVRAGSVPSPIKVVREKRSGRYEYDLSAGAGAGGRVSGGTEGGRDRNHSNHNGGREMGASRNNTPAHARELQLQQTFPETPTAFSPGISPPSSAFPPPSSSSTTYSSGMRSSSLVGEYLNMVVPSTPMSSGSQGGHLQNQFPLSPFVGQSQSQWERESQVLLARAATSIHVQRNRVSGAHAMQGSLGRAATVGPGAGVGVTSLERVGEGEERENNGETETEEVKVEETKEKEKEHRLKPPDDASPAPLASIPLSSRPPSRSSLPQPGPPPQTPLPSTPAPLASIPLPSTSANSNSGTPSPCTPYTPPAPVLGTVSLPRLTPEPEFEPQAFPAPDTSRGSEVAVLDSPIPSLSTSGGAKREGDESKNTSVKKAVVRVPPPPTQAPPQPSPVAQLQLQLQLQPPAAPSGAYAPALRPPLVLPSTPRIPLSPSLEGPSTPHSAHASPILHRMADPVSPGLGGTPLTTSTPTSTASPASARRPGMINPPPPHLHLPPAPPSASSLYSLSYDPTTSPPPYAAVISSDRSAGDVITPSTGGSYDSNYRFGQNPHTPTPPPVNAASEVGASGGHGYTPVYPDRVAVGQQQTGHVHGHVHGGHSHGPHRHAHGHGHAHGPQTNSVILGPRRRTRPPLPAGPRRPSQPQQRERNGSVSSVNSQHQPPQPARPPRQLSAPLPAPQFATSPPKWRGYTLEMAKWTFTSEQLQGIVSRAIRQSAEPSGIRLLQLETVETEIPEEIERLEMLRADTMVKYKALARRRADLFEMMLGAVDAQDPDVAFRQLEELKELCGSLDKATEDLHSLDEQLAQLEQLTQAHSSSALAMALRKLNASFLRQLEQVRDLMEQVEALQTERDDAWKHAAEVATEYDELKSGKIESPDMENRFERVMAVRKSSTRAARAGLRTASIRSNHRDRASIGSSVRGLIGTPASTRNTYVDDRPPVPAIPRRRPIDINTNIPVRSSAVTGVSTEFSTPNSDTRAMQRAQDELYDMLGIPVTERSRRSRSAIGPLKDTDPPQQATSPSLSDFDAPPNTGRRASLPSSAPLPPDPYYLTANASIMWASDRAGWI